MLGNGDGTFQAAVTASKQTGTMAVGDFNGDGKPDLALAGVPAYILLGNGNGTFQNPIAAAGDLVAGFGVAVGDFNGDGKLDVVTGATGGVSWCSAMAKETWLPPSHSATGPRSFPIRWSWATSMATRNSIS